MPTRRNGTPASGTVTDRPPARHFDRVYLTATGAFYPGEAVDNDRIDEYVAPLNGASPHIKRRILAENGIQRRYILFQLVKIVVPNGLTSSRLLHRLVAWGLRTFVRPEANWLLLRHFHIGSEILDFIARNVPDTEVPLNPLRPVSLSQLRDHLFVKHDLNLFNFVINLNRELHAQRREVTRPPRLVFDGISEGAFGIEPLPDTWHNVIDLQTAIELPSSR